MVYTLLSGTLNNLNISSNLPLVEIKPRPILCSWWLSVVFASPWPAMLTKGRSLCHRCYHSPVSEAARWQDNTVLFNHSIQTRQRSFNIVSFNVFPSCLQEQLMDFVEKLDAANADMDVKIAQLQEESKQRDAWLKSLLKQWQAEQCPHNQLGCPHDQLGRLHNQLGCPHNQLGCPQGCTSRASTWPVCSCLHQCWHSGMWTRALPSTVAVSLTSSLSVFLFVSLSPKVLSTYFLLSFRFSQGESERLTLMCVV